MILPDLNLILYASNPDSSFHPAALAWWEEALSSPKPLALCWSVLLGFLRVSTHPRVFSEPLSVSSACNEVSAWLAQPQVVILEPGDRHAAILFDLLQQVGTGGNLTSDAHLAALAIEHRCELASTDRDFARFRGLRWTNPLSAHSG